MYRLLPGIGLTLSGLYSSAFQYFPCIAVLLVLVQIKQVQTNDYHLTDTVYWLILGIGLTLSGIYSSAFQYFPCNNENVTMVWVM